MNYRHKPARVWRINEMPLNEHPHDRLQRHGVQALSDAELLSMVLGRADGLCVAQHLLQTCGSLHELARSSRAKLSQFYGIGRAQAARLQAVCELSRRLQEPSTAEREHIFSPSEAVKLLMPQMRDLSQEELRVMLLNTRNRVLGIETIYRGSVNGIAIRLGELFRPAIEAQAKAIILAHNHPSGDPSPSAEDGRVTREARQVGELLGIELLDHLIIGDGRYVSLKERGLGFEGDLTHA